jgi:LmbE family N-acetylglucosaminyl deacetylase
MKTDHRFAYRVPFLLLLTAILISSSDFFTRSSIISTLRDNVIPDTSLAGIQRLLVIAPHPDDETLGAGGLIQEALAEGIDVKVIVVTNGDGQRFAPLAIKGRVRPRSSDYVAMGEMRQQETLSAVSHFGLGLQDVIFLGYPDRNLNRLWINDWQSDCPLRSSFTKAYHSLYPISYDPQANYCGSDLLNDLKAFLSSYRPDLIVMPHPDDDHPDHQAVSNFVRFAVGIQSNLDPDFHPLLWGYIVHYEKYPTPRGNHMDKTLLPPIPLSLDDNLWMSLTLSDKEIVNKTSALSEYKTQVRLLGKFLPSFARRNEIFCLIGLPEISSVEFNTLGVGKIRDGESISLPERSRESNRKLILRRIEIVGWQITRLGNWLFIFADTRGGLLPGFDYVIQVKSTDGSTRVFSSKHNEVIRGLSSYISQVNLDQFSGTPVLAVSAEVREGFAIEHTGWIVLILRDGLP